MMWAGNVARRIGRGVPYRVLEGVAEGKRPIGRHRLRGEDNIKINI